MREGRSTEPVIVQMAVRFRQTGGIAKVPDL